MKKYIFQIVKVILIDVLITFISVLFLSFLLYKFKLGDSVLKKGIIIVYALSNFVGGFIIGKIKENKKFIWGMVTGMVYFAVLTLISVLVTGQLYGNGNMAVAALCTSVIGGCIGGMIS